MSSTDHGTISAGQDLTLIGPDDLAVPLSCDLHYDQHDPYAIQLALYAGGAEPVRWFVSRDLLATALHAADGIGDVRAWPSAERVSGVRTLNIELGPREGCARFEASADGIGDFLARTYELVPDGAEPAFLNLDAELAELLDQA
jgi:hypothetical protein